MTRGAIAGALALALAGCGTPSALDPDERVRVEGRVVAADGRPAAGTEVALRKRPGALDLLVAAPFVVPTFGVACPEPVCGAARRVRTDGAGRFAFDLRGRDTQGAGGQAATLLFGTAASGGASTGVALRVQEPAVRLPDLALWEPVLRLRGGRATWREDASSDRHRLTFTDARGALVWSVAEASSPTRVDPRLLEDVRGSAVVEALRGGVVRRSPPAPLRGRAVPPSRGRPCTVRTAGGELVGPAPCPATDGAMGASRPLTGAREVVVDLGARRELALVVLRGCGLGCTVEGVGEVAGEVAALRPERGRRFRTLRVTGSRLELREIAAWPRG